MPSRAGSDLWSWFSYSLYCLGTNCTLSLNLVGRQANWPLLGSLIIIEVPVPGAGVKCEVMLALPEPVLMWKLRVRAAFMLDFSILFKSSAYFRFAFEEVVIQIWICIYINI